MFLCADMFFMWRNRVCLSVRPPSQSVCPYPEKRNRPGFVNISPTSVWLVFWLVPKCLNHTNFVNVSPTVEIIDTSMEKFTRVLQHGPPKNFNFSSQNVEIEFWLVFWLVPKCLNHTNFVNISPTVEIIDASMEKFTWVLQHGNPKHCMIFYFKNSSFCIWVSAVMLCKQCLVFTVHIDYCNNSIHKHSCRAQHISVLTTCTCMTTSGMHRRPFQGRHLVRYKLYNRDNKGKKAICEVKNQIGLQTFNTRHSV